MSTTERNSLWQNYNLQHDPFSNRSSTSYYPIAEWEQHLDLVHHLLHFSNVLLNISGSKGAGKTTFLQQFLQQLDEDLLCTHTIGANPNFSLEELVAVFRDNFGAQISAGSTAFETLEAQLEELQHFQQLSVLIVDDAHLLNDDVLQVLLELIHQQSENQMRLHVMFLALPSLKERLAVLCKKNEFTDLTYDIELEPLTGQQTKQYLDHRFRDAGLVGEFPLKDNEINRIWKMSRGNPYQIHVSALQTMLPKPEPQKITARVSLPKAKPTVTDVDSTHKKNSVRPTIRLRLTKQHKVSLSIALLLLGAFLAVSYLQKNFQTNAAQVATVTKPAAAISKQDNLTKPPTPTATDTVTTDTTTKPAKVTRNIIVLPSTAVSTPSSSKSLGQQTLIFVKHEDTTRSSVIAPIALNASPIPTNTAKSTTETQAANNASQAQNNTTTKNNTAKDTPQTKETAERSEPSNSVTEVKSASTEANAATKTTSKTASKEKKAAEEKPVTKETTTAKPQTTVDKNKYNEDERFLLRQSPNRYTLQLIASVDRDLLLKESRVILNKKKYPYYLFRYGPQWHVLTYGIYDSFDEAKAAVASIPKSLRSQIKPWPRELSLIHGEIQQPR